MPSSTVPTGVEREIEHLRQAKEVGTSAGRDPHTLDQESREVLQYSGEETIKVKQSLRQLDRKSWWHWWNAVLVIMLLMGAIVALSLPRVLTVDDPSFQLELGLAVRGLLGLVLIFNVYTLYQQYLLRQLRNNLATQVELATKNQVRAETLYELAIIDPLTGLYNRRISEERLKTEIARAERNGTPLLVMHFDLDNFKQINDQYGHPGGDLVLKEFARRLTKATRGMDFAVRMGGDEFLVVLPECPQDKAQLILERLVPFTVEIDSKKVLVSSSRGWAQYQAGDTTDQLIRRADQALYEHKATRHTQRV